jgi:hypothetical protein
VKAGAIGSIPTVAVGSIANVVVLAGTVVVLAGGAVVLVVLVVEEVVDDVGGGSACNSNAPISTALPETRTYGVPR